MATKEQLEDQVKELKAKLETPKLIYYKPEKLCSFDGSSDISEWIDDCKLVLPKSVTEAEKIQFVSSHISGLAKREVKIHGTVSTVEDIFTILLESFEGPKLLSEAQRTFFERVQLPGESVRDFSISLSELMSNINRIKSTSMSDEVLRDHFISGLRDSVLRKELRRSTTDNPSIKFMDCRKTAIMWTSDTDLNMNAPIFEPQVNKIETSEIVELKKIVEKQQIQINDLVQCINSNSNQVQVQDQRQIKCY